MALFCVAIRRDSASVLALSFLSYVQVFLLDISLVYRLKYLYNCFSTHFCFLLIFMFFVLFLVAVISLSLHFVSSSRFDASMLS